MCFVINMLFWFLFPGARTHTPVWLYKNTNLSPVLLQPTLQLPKVAPIAACQEEGRVSQLKLRYPPKGIAQQVLNVGA